MEKSNRRKLGEEVFKLSLRQMETMKCLYSAEWLTLDSNFLD